MQYRKLIETAAALAAAVINFVAALLNFYSKL